MLSGCILLLLTFVLSCACLSLCSRVLVVNTCVLPTLPCISLLEQAFPASPVSTHKLFPKGKSLPLSAPGRILAARRPHRRTTCTTPTCSVLVPSSMLRCLPVRACMFLVFFKSCLRVHVCAKAKNTSACVRVRVWVSAFIVFRACAFLRTDMRCVSTYSLILPHVLTHVLYRRNSRKCMTE